MSEDRLLRVRDLRKSYLSGDQPLEVLKGVTLELQAGRALAVTGESGAGKSTLLHLIGGMEPPDSGEILFRDINLAGLTGPELAAFRNREVGFIFQFHHLLPEFSAVENVMFPLLLRHVPFEEAKARGDLLLREVGLAERRNHRPGELSGGEQQRVATARALSGEPRLLLADEPTGNLDHKTAQGIHELLFRVQREHLLTLVLVTHNASLAALCDRHLHLADGVLKEPD